jgi:protein TonB
MNVLLRTTLLLLVCLSLVNCKSNDANTNKETLAKAPTALQLAAYQKHYGAYKAAMAAGDQLYAAEQLELAFRKARAVHAVGSIEYADLCLEVANMRYEMGLGFRAHLLYRIAANTFEKVHGKDSQLVIEPLLGASASASEPHLQVEYAEHAVDIALRNSDLNLIAVTKAKAFDLLNSELQKEPRYLKWLTDAEHYVGSNEQTDPRLKYHVMRLRALSYANSREFNPAVRLLNQLIEQSAPNSDFRTETAKARALLFKIHLDQGNAELATEQCVALGAMHAWNHATPLLRSAPDYPAAELSNGVTGYAVLSFRVDELGQVQEVKILKTEGSESFGLAAQKSLMQWRYIPRFVNDKAIPFDSKVQIDFR